MKILETLKGAEVDKAARIAKTENAMILLGAPLLALLRALDLRCCLQAFITVLAAVIHSLRLEPLTEAHLRAIRQRVIASKLAGY